MDQGWQRLAVIKYLKRLITGLRGDQIMSKTTPYFKALIKRRLDKRWEEESAVQLRGHRWLRVNIGYGPAASGRRHAQQFWPHMATPRHASQFTYAITAHAPIGEYLQCFGLQNDSKCPTCPMPQTRKHILTACSRYHSFPTFFLPTQPNSASLLADFLRAHPAAFSFAHAPYEPP